jgi:hypothetical protein
MGVKRLVMALFTLTRLSIGRAWRIASTVRGAKCL